MNNKVITIIGTTASGKTKLAVDLARKFNGEIISADSRQVYKGMDIGTGKDLAEYGEVPYHLIDIVKPEEQFSLAEYQKLAYEKIEDILKRGKLPIICGGTGLYVSAIVEGYRLSETAGPDENLRKRLGEMTFADLLEELEQIDPETYEIIDRQNRRRVERALEIYYQTGLKKSEQIKKTKPPYEFLQLGLTFPREVLNQRIEQRLKTRLEQEGMIDEVKRLREQGISWQRLDDFGLEYRWVAKYLQNNISYDEMFNELKHAISQFAKRQMTWFKRNQEIQWLTSPESAEKLVKEFLEKK